jgi:hypothetical protein
MKDLRQIRLIPIKIHPRESKVQKTLRQIRLIPIKIYARESKAQKTYPECYTYFFHPCGIRLNHPPFRPRGSFCVLSSTGFFVYVWCCDHCRSTAGASFSAAFGIPYMTPYRGQFLGHICVWPFTMFSFRAAYVLAMSSLLSDRCFCVLDWCSEHWTVH